MMTLFSKLHFFGWGFLLLLGVSACAAGSLPAAAPQPTETKTPTAVPLGTLIPTTTPFATVTLDIKIEPVKRVLLEYGTFGGGGANVTQEEFYLGRDIPSLVIYTDGQMVTNQDGTLITSQLTAANLCLLMGRLQSAGYFGANLFTSNVPVQGGDAPTIILLLNGTPARLAFIPKNDLGYVSGPINTALNLVNDLKHNEATFYEPQRLLLWVQPVSAADAKGLKVFDWPATLPPISQLWKDQTLPHALLEGSIADEVLRLFGHHMQSLYFNQQGQVYHLIARPLLPHETSTRYSLIPDRTEFFDEPVGCLGQPFFAPTPTLTATQTAPATTVEPTLSPQRSALSGRGRILFNSDRSGNLQIYMMNSDGSGLVRLTNNLANDQSPTYSPDGSRLPLSATGTAMMKFT